jgi:hypothetical protein
VWRNSCQDPNGSCSKAGQTCYDDLYADILLWLQKGWIDYIVPQLYWSRKHKLCDYDTLLAWWNNHTYGKHLYIGHGLYKAGTESAWRDKNELPNQIKALRNYSTTQGSIYFSSKDFTNNPNGWCDSLNNNYYNHPSIVPPMPWIDDTPPPPPIIVSNQNNTFDLIYKGMEPIKGFAVFTGLEDEKINTSNPYTSNKIFVEQPARHLKTLLEVIPSYKKTITIHANNLPRAKNERLFVATIDKNNNISSYLELK